jgi:hypothetical protein
MALRTRLHDIVEHQGMSFDASIELRDDLDATRQRIRLATPPIPEQIRDFMGAVSHF